MFWSYFVYVVLKILVLQDPVIKPLHELQKSILEDILTQIPLWIKWPDCDRVDWLNKFVLDMWPYLDKRICSTIRSMAQTIFTKYIKAIEFGELSLGTLPPIIYATCRFWDEHIGRPSKDKSQASTSSLKDLISLPSTLSKQLNFLVVKRDVYYYIDISKHVVHQT